jgi:hypothetical protein
MLAPDQGTRWPEPLAYRRIACHAQVPPMAAGLAWEAAGGSSQRAEAAREARELLDLAERDLTQDRLRLVVIGGLPGTGKSTLAVRVAGALGATLLRSDEVRRQLAGIDPGEPAPAPFGQGLYRPEMTEATYAELLRLAREALVSGQSVVADASWHEPGWRDQAVSLAGATGAEPREFRCVLPTDVIMQRITGGGAAGGQSEATAAVVRGLAASIEPWPSAADVDTTASPDEVAEEVLRMIAAGGAGESRQQGGA